MDGQPIYLIQYFDQSLGGNEANARSSFTEYYTDDLSAFQSAPVYTGGFASSVLLPIIVDGSLLGHYLDWYAFITVANALDPNIPFISLPNPGDPPPSELFTKLSDRVNFNDLTPDQIEALKKDANKYAALDGSDTVTLPNAIALPGGAIWNADNTFKAGDGFIDEIIGGLLNDKIDGGLGNDVVYGGAGNDTLFGSPGTDLLSGDGGNDTFDFVSGEHGGFSGFGAGATAQTLDGGTEDAGGKDLLKLPGSPNDYTFSVQLNPTWGLTSTTIKSKVGSGLADVSVLTRDIENAVFADPLDNPVAPSGSNVVVEMGRQMVDVYNPAITADSRNWHPVAAIELGLKPSDYGPVTDQYTFVDGVFKDVSPSGLLSPTGSTFALFNTAVASITAGVVNGQRTLSVAFRGTEDLKDLVIDIGKVWAPSLLDSYYEKLRPLVDGLKRYLSENASDIDRVLVSGHSLGGALTQHFIDELTKADFGDKIDGFAFGSIGDTLKTVSGVSDKLVNFIHADDIANRLNLDPNADTRGGSQVWIDSSPKSLKPSSLAEHSVVDYQSDLISLVGWSHDSASPFFNSSLAFSLRQGIAWDQNYVDFPGKIRINLF